METGETQYTTTADDSQSASRTWKTKAVTRTAGPVGKQSVGAWMAPRVDMMVSETTGRFKTLYQGVGEPFQACDLLFLFKCWRDLSSPANRNNADIEYTPI